MHCGISIPPKMYYCGISGGTEMHYCDLSGGAEMYCGISIPPEMNCGIYVCEISAPRASSSFPQKSATSPCPQRRMNDYNSCNYHGNPINMTPILSKRVPP